MNVRSLRERYVPFSVYDEDDARRRAEEERDDLRRARERRERADEHGSTGWHMADVRVEAVEEVEAA